MTDAGGACGQRIALGIVLKTAAEGAGLLFFPTGYLQLLRPVNWEVPGFLRGVCVYFWPCSKASCQLEVGRPGAFSPFLAAAYRG